jgi:Holliday junction resolvase-like predicted endonuclease
MRIALAEDWNQALGLIDMIMSFLFPRTVGGVEVMTDWLQIWESGIASVSVNYFICVCQPGHPR